MAEWHVPFDHIETNWTEGQFRLMLERYNERKKAEHKASQRGHKRGRESGGFVPYGEA